MTHADDAGMSRPSVGLLCPGGSAPITHKHQGTQAAGATEGHALIALSGLKLTPPPPPAQALSGRPAVSVSFLPEHSVPAGLSGALQPQAQDSLSSI